MSFSFAYVARTKTRAKELADAQLNDWTPQAVVDFVKAAIDGLDGLPEETLISVSANGHMANGTQPHSYPVSGATIEVKPLTLVE